MNIKTIPVVLFFVLISLTVFSQNENKKDFIFPDYVGYVNDFEEIFSSEQISELKEIIIQHEKMTTNEIVVVTIKSCAPYETLNEYSIELANYWNASKKNKNNTVLIFLGKQIRQIRIEVGYELENKLNDEEAKIILDNIIIPEFKKGDFYEGIKKGILEIINKII